MDYKHCYSNGKYDRLQWSRLYLGQMRYVYVDIFDDITKEPQWLVCKKNGFACASCNTSALLLPAMAPRALEYHQPDWPLAHRSGHLRPATFCEAIGCRLEEQRRHAIDPAIGLVAYFTNRFDAYYLLG